MDVFNGLPNAIIVDILNKFPLKAIQLTRPHPPTRACHHHQVTTWFSCRQHIFISLLDSSHGYQSRFSRPITFKNLSPSILSKTLSLFDRIKKLEVVLPGNDASLGLEKGAAVKWRAECGKTLETDAELETELKTRMDWTISALMAMSTRHFLMSEVLKEHEEMESLVIHDKEGEGTVVMGLEGLREF
ncbi:unnamed protein product [Eruca vesicaria subsp. sativa]|uniref:F-box protein n=1 Tax=Eruca vesicaria subsp. sativa TaxID=29727 RepID=A0ABC8IZC0_ERUVS|nr:unnamed protein product [Eruca vesicaria subsp. sativa]